MDKFSKATHLIPGKSDYIAIVRTEDVMIVGLWKLMKQGEGRRWLSSSWCSRRRDFWGPNKNLLPSWIPIAGSAEVSAVLVPGLLFLEVTKGHATKLLSGLIMRPPFIFVSVVALGRSSSRAFSKLVRGILVGECSGD
ncbi:hypothetical protein PHISCL_08079 [Aspergillus sclerotialis]|uniref:Uncharacterized protein n=1 Tax=Aspergillus sclerotialis TaxID=2070753 RepID=A0A3A2Z905_9EURO|nr:hypothetical protein PHISCL_08079 [Aspergillus sclerotialis]